LTDLLGPLVEQKNEPKVEAAYAGFFRDPLHKFSQEESAVEAMAHGLIDDSNPTFALLLFRLNLQTNPKSTLAFDGLGDAYVALKQLKDARNAYASALKIDPRDSLAASGLSQLQAAQP
jgi:cytochrome c-type biogenesis protein CcmH/NrfG